MLDNETKRRIDTARDILVGKVPDPKSQVEQITIALIYKFMDDMDAEAEELGGERTFFQGEYAQYGWSRLLAPDLSSYEMLSRYSEALAKMNQNPNIPQLFRDIFKNTFLPYRDPATLKSFLKIINDFLYDHSERLGDAFEYLLSVMDSQGDAGQFRTPRHVIDFMVAVLDPQKHQRILDPACGTAGFLISAYKHILAANSQDGRPGAALTPDERQRLATNINGYDISPDMVRLSRVNLYLHGFSNPLIHEYDTLTSEDKWDERVDVILANPPFMSPKGGIRPHKRFSVQSNRSEVLFVDYIAEHLNPGGRAAVIVPEGIIFQSQRAYKQLRKMLVEHYLFGVVSLPAGVFQPYSGVKTSILFMDKSLAKRLDSIIFVKIESDGFDLGAQRRPVDRNDLPAALRTIRNYELRMRNGEEFDTEQWPNVLVVKRAQIAENGDYTLSAERYKNEELRIMNYELVSLEDIAEIEYGYTETAQDNGDTRFIRITDINENGQIKDTGKKFITLSEDSRKYLLQPNDIIVARTGATYGKTAIFDKMYNAAFASYLIRVKFDKTRVNPKFYWNFAQTDFYWEQAKKLVSGGGQPQFNGQAIKQIKIPLPPLEVQEAIVAEIGGYQKSIDEAQKAIEAYKKKIQDTITAIWGKKP